MKFPAVLVIVLLVATSIFVPGRPKDFPADQIVTQSKQMMVDYRTWMAAKPRKLAIRFLEARDLPDRIAKLRFKSATIEEGLVILISSGDDVDPIEGVAVATDRKDLSNLLRDFGWEVTNSSDSRIKHLKRKKAQQVTAPNRLAAPSLKSE
ncbi:MAG: hypothetical protein V4733_12645 [Verrucomicrobiota bacterium]